MADTNAGECNRNRKLYILAYSNNISFVQNKTTDSRRADTIMPLRSSYSENGATKVLSLRTSHSWPTWTWRPKRLKSSCPSLLADIKREVSKRWTAPSSKDLATPSWWREETTVKSSYLSESWSKHSKLCISLLEKTLFKSLLMLFQQVELERIPLELVAAVLSEDKQSMFPHWGESTKLFISSLEDQESLLSEQLSQSLNVSLMRLLPALR